MNGYFVPTVPKSSTSGSIPENLVQVYKLSPETGYIRADRVNEYALIELQVLE
jgi:hypothetical protein